MQVKVYCYLTFFLDYAVCYSNQVPPDDFNAQRLLVFFYLLHIDNLRLKDKK